MDKQKQQNLVKRYVSFFAFCVVILLIGVIFSVPIKVEVHSVDEKPPFIFALLFSIMLLATAIGMAYSTYLGWFQEAKARSNVKRTIEELAKRFLFFVYQYTIPLLYLVCSDY
jgi:tryptophan-rich sensory protein